MGSCIQLGQHKASDTACQQGAQKTYHHPKKLLCPFSRKLLWISSSNLPGNFALKNGGDFWWILLAPFPTKWSTKTPQQIQGKFGAKFGAKSGKKIRKFGELLFCNFSDVRKASSGGNLGDVIISEILLPFGKTFLTRERSQKFKVIKFWNFGSETYGGLLVANFCQFSEENRH